jgi:hypothetical protein
MNTRRNPIADQNLALAAPTAERLVLRLALNNAMPALYPVRYRHHAALPEDRRLP